MHKLINSFAIEASYLLNLDSFDDEELIPAAQAYSSIILESQKQGIDHDLIIYSIIHGIIWQKAAGSDYEEQANDIQAQLHSIFIQIQSLANQIIALENSL